MNIELKFGKKTVAFDIKTNNFFKTLEPATYSSIFTGHELIQEALSAPIGTERLENIITKNDRVVIVTSDISRPMPSHKVLPPLIERLEKAGVPMKNICIVLALGSHRKHTEEEKEKLVGSRIYHSNVQVLDSDMNDCVRLGICDHGTLVDVFRPVAQADRLICLGNIEYHYFAGYSGGAKAIMPGVSSRDAIQANHRNMVHPEARAANLDANPVRMDIDQVAEFIKIDFILNVVLSPEKKIIGAFAGHWKEAHRAGCAFLDRIYGIPLDQKADIALVSPGGFPKDINLYQAQKGLDNAKHAVKKGGTIILCASAKEGFGESHFERWMLDKTPGERVEAIRRKFILGGHKAAAIGQVQEMYQVILLSDMPEDIVLASGFEYAQSPEKALEMALDKQGDDAQVIVMPSAGSTLPLIQGQK